MGGTNNVAVGAISHGTNIFYGAVYFSGNFGEGWQWGARISQRAQTENGLGLTVGNPAYCTSANPTGNNGATPSSCSYQDFCGTSGNIATAIDYFYVGWQSPGGLYTQFGRFSLADYLYIPKGLKWNGQNVTGVRFGINDPNKTFGAWVAYLPRDRHQLLAGERQRSPLRVVHEGRRAEHRACSSRPVSSGSCTNSAQEFAAEGQYFFKQTRTALGRSSTAGGTSRSSYWDPAAVACSIKGAAATLAWSAPVCAGQRRLDSAWRTRLHAPPGAPTSRAVPTSTADGPDAYYTVELSQYFGCCNTLGQYNVTPRTVSRLGNDPFTGASWTDPNVYQVRLYLRQQGQPVRQLAERVGPGHRYRQLQRDPALLYVRWARKPATNGWGFGGSIIPENNNDLPVIGVGGRAVGIRRPSLTTGSTTTSAPESRSCTSTSTPTSRFPAGSLTCPGCFVNTVNLNQVYLDTFLYIN